MVYDDIQLTEKYNWLMLWLMIFLSFFAPYGCVRFVCIKYGVRVCTGWRRLIIIPKSISAPRPQHYVHMCVCAVCVCVRIEPYRRTDAKSILFICIFLYKMPIQQTACATQSQWCIIVKPNTNIIIFVGCSIAPVPFRLELYVNEYSVFLNLYRL